MESAAGNSSPPSRRQKRSSVGWESPWPAIRDAEADLAFDRGGMTIRNGQGRIFGVELRGIQGGVSDFLQQPVLEIEGQGRGPLADFTRFVNVTPVGQWIGGALAQAGTDGAADLRLALNLPLTQPAQSTLRGSVQLGGNEIRLAPDTPLLFFWTAARTLYSEGSDVGAVLFPAARGWAISSIVMMTGRHRWSTMEGIR